MGWIERRLEAEPSPGRKVHVALPMTIALPPEHQHDEEHDTPLVCKGQAKAGIEEALTALGDMSEARNDGGIRIKDLEGALATVLRERDVSEALRAAQAEQYDSFLARLHDAETGLQQERQMSLDLKLTQARAEVERESLDRQCGSIRAKLEITRTAAEQHKLDLALLRESEGRNLEAIRQRDLEIVRLRVGVEQAEAAILALMERAIAAEQPGRALPATASPPIADPAAAGPRRRDRKARRARTDVHTSEVLELDHSIPNKMAAQPTVGIVGAEPALSSIAGNVP
jgi:hypothetical protein